MSTERLTRPGAPPVRRSPRRDRIEVILSRAVGIVGIAFGLMAFPVAIEQREILSPMGFWVTLIAVYGSLVVNVVASIVQRFVRTANAAVAIIWLVTMALWPLFVVDAAVVVDGRAWPWFLASVAVAAAAGAYLKVRRPITYLAMAVIAYGYVRLLPSGGGAPLDEMLLDVLSTVTFGGAVITIFTVFRRASSAVDKAQAAALSRYAEAATQDAISRERVRVDALVHDSVLTTLVEAARSTTPEAMELSARMAEEAIGHLEAAGEASSRTTEQETEQDAGSSLAARLEQAVAQLGGDVVLRVGELEGRMLPLAVSDALHSAAMQAVINSLQHAGARVARWLAVHAVGDSGIRVEVGDTGVGFLIDELPSERLGLRVSVIERVTAVGGSVEIDSHPGEGTIVTLQWPGNPEGSEKPS
ncbi:MAG: ATP-binding protein [Cryobacterium sp.]|nr:ATP-binding protein [Cryobacterium sp.]